MMVVAPAPRLDHVGSNNLEKPRVISEIRKNKKKKTQNFDSKPRISGSLDWGVEGCSPWQARHVEVRDGSLVVLTSPTGCPELRIPLRHLNLQPGKRPRAFSLSRDQAPPVASFQAGSEQEYERWVKTLAIELMRQTPLEAIKFLDILGITSTLHPPDSQRPLRRGASEDNLTTLGADHRPTRPRIYEAKANNCAKPTTIVESRVNREHFIVNNLRGDRDVLLKRQNNSAPVVVVVSDSESSSSDADYEKDFAELLSKCQQVEKYVPVREKRRLFESLCRGRPFAQSSENIYGIGRGHLGRPNRAQSLHDLSQMKCNKAVSEICRYFEQRGCANGDVGSAREEYMNRRRLHKSERRLARIKKETYDVEEELWRIQEEMATLDKERDSDVADRSMSLKLYNALESRLAQEEERLTRLQTDAAAALKEVELAANKFETTVVQSNGENNSRQ